METIREHLHQNGSVIVDLMATLVNFGSAPLGPCPALEPTPARSKYGAWHSENPRDSLPSTGVMSNQNESVLQRALAIRLNLQIMVSQLPIVEEWMDIHLTRWLEYVPLPPELPAGHESNFLVKLGTDLGSLTWSAYGNPAGFIPKMSDYFEKEKLGAADISLIDQLGNKLEPALVGMWITVTENTIDRGWQFCDRHPFAELVDAFSDHEAKATIIAWLAESGVTHFQRFSQSIGDTPFTEIEFGVPGVAIDDQIASVSAAFRALSGSDLPDYVAEALSAAPEPRFSVSARVSGGVITQVAVQSPTLGNDVVAKLCADAGTPYEGTVSKIQGALRATGSERVEYSRSGERQRIEVHIVPTDTAIGSPISMN